MREFRNVLRGLRARDAAISDWVAGWHSPMLDRTLPQLSLAASYSRLWIGTGTLIALVYGRRGRRAAMGGLIAIAITSAVANLAIKPLVNRRRPGGAVPETRRLDHPESTSFPSGHSASAAAFAGAVGADIPSLRLPVNALAAVVGFSRVYTGVHHPSDVIVGWVLGKAVARIVHRVSRRVIAR